MLFKAEISVQPNAGHLYDGLCAHCILQSHEVIQIIDYMFLKFLFMHQTPVSCYWTVVRSCCKINFLTHLFMHIFMCANIQAALPVSCHKLSDVSAATMSYWIDKLQDDVYFIIIETEIMTCSVVE